MSTETAIQREFVKVGLSEDKQRVVLLIKDREDDVAAIPMSQEQALTLAGQIQGHAFMIRKP